MRENLTSGSMWQGMGNPDMAKVLRHSQKKWRATGLPCLRLWHHPLTLLTFRLNEAVGFCLLKNPIEVCQMTIPSYSNNNPHPTAVIREMRYMVRNTMALYAPYIKFV
jgi:hypothetical protein